MIAEAFAVMNIAEGVVTVADGIYQGFTGKTIAEAIEESGSDEPAREQQRYYSNPYAGLNQRLLERVIEVLEVGSTGTPTVIHHHDNHKDEEDMQDEEPEEDDGPEDEESDEY